MRVARYIGNGEVDIVEEPTPSCPEGGLLVRTLACGLCSGELMAWYMDGKIPHVLGHEVCGEVIESDSPEFPVGSKVFPHHHAPCLKCEACLGGREVHCAQWKTTKLLPGGMADFFAVNRGNLTDTHRVDDLRPIDAALIEPLACVCKALRLAEFRSSAGKAAVLGLGNMGILHLLCLPETAVGYDLERSRISWARSQGLRVDHVSQAEPAMFVFVCPGTQAAFDQAMKMVQAQGTLVMFAPLGPGEALKIPQAAYFSDVKIVNSYSCGPSDTSAAIKLIRSGGVKAEQVCSNFIELSELPSYYRKMKTGEVLKAMVVWP